MNLWNTVFNVSLEAYHVIQGALGVCKEAEEVKTLKNGEAAEFPAGPTAVP